MTNDTLLALIRSYGDACGSAAIWGQKDGYTFPGSVTTAQEYRDKSAKLLAEISAELNARFPVSTT